MVSQKQFDPASGTRDFLAAEHERRERAFATIREVFGRYGFQPLQTPAFERLEVLTGKYGDEGDKLIFKILRRGEHEATGEADLALRYDLTVPLARTVAAYGNQLPSPYKRYAIAPVWRADRPGKGRFREFVQCDLDIVGSSSPLSDAEVVLALHDALDALGVPGFRFLLNSRRVLFGLLEAYGVPADLGPGALITLDKLDKLAPEQVVAELVTGRGLAEEVAQGLVDDLTAPDAVERIRGELKGSETGQAGLAEIDRLLRLTKDTIPAERIAFTPNLVRGLDYYTGIIFEVSAPGMPGSIASGGRYDNLIATLGGKDAPACGGSLGIERILPLLDHGDADGYAQIDVAVTVMGEELAADTFRLAAEIRRAGVRTGVYLGASGKFRTQMKWANDQGARFCVIYGAAERDAGTVTVRDMESGEQTPFPLDQAATELARRCARPH
ncbi:histidine--tRNA ligase [Streptomyces clavuligerus]|uniref:Histidine--tRNA ligase n=1 Tax=Streptomyces clavuligerus TaxID=1901 RepID=E2Q7F4_STRCL|nr:histidine--tRNA ligase [Streptomyces clavuligerus]ANW19788.1 histidine--tRNA ligase [Streptomyces clavuligerus]AXU14403.1 histidine--tRNA ligase [Streptomyces clavuligerus]EFG07360.1 Histidyl-tRNA synthetase [Streptomyces clavuligerus]MBY6304410.1 histidine--tRNA ligase [Streptomyces clavuligerus]QCS07177.1 histidine--tRNA ligase [Streptomyces clavuligerus]